MTDILILPHPALRRGSAAVERVDENIRILSERMLATMYASKGVGLAAPQIGIALNVIVVDVSRQHDAEYPLCLVNPEILVCSDETISFEEGCLSLPGIYAEITRPKELEVQYLDLNEKRQRLVAKGFLATCLQHEIDHLNGRLFIDHLSAFRRSRLIKKFQTHGKHKK